MLDYLLAADSSFGWGYFEQDKINNSDKGYKDIWRLVFLCQLLFSLTQTYLSFYDELTLILSHFFCFSLYFPQIYVFIAPAHWQKMTKKQNSLHKWPTWHCNQKQESSNILEEELFFKFNFQLVSCFVRLSVLIFLLLVRDLFLCYYCWLKAITIFWHLWLMFLLVNNLD